MSSLRNAVKRVTHKERAQPKARAKFGLLEKKKDYKERAIDAHRKRDRIQALMQRKALRNPDEFYFGMHNAQMKEGRHRGREDNPHATLDTKTIQLLKDQDLGYLNMQKQVLSKQVNRKKASLQFLDQSESGGKHTLFVTDAKNFDPAEHFDTLPEMVDRRFNRMRTSDLEKQQQAAAEDSLTEDQLKEERKSARRVARRLARAKSAAYKSLNNHERKVEVIDQAASFLQVEKLMGSKGRKRKIKEAEGGQPAQFKW
eukprot:CAMPEP_0194045122 /NCGR_PEP_ID=MMETSP0009_2-20130614/16492_1 /TAXON_ID=210454 /ORGANISM="Grammatophora oceanica, Strain CCMP 410" /LENGTH=256 /DNA_ID=CAMNT_0038689879 /DNA_START=9 /DNA_END=776 /DNA_ORIENTATION=-